MSTTNLKNINFMSEKIYSGLESVKEDELYAVEIETYKDLDGNWYRIFPDGWCIQGGMIPYNAANKVEISFLKPFASMEYAAFISGYWNACTGAACAVDYKASSATTLVTYRDGTSMGAAWMACGYIVMQEDEPELEPEQSRGGE